MTSPRRSTRRASRCARATTVRSRSCAGVAWSARAAPASPSTTRPRRSACSRTRWPRSGQRPEAMSMPGPRNPFQSPRFGQIATFMLLPAAADAAGLDVALLGVPYDGGTSYRTGARFGPRAVREQSSLIRTWNPVLKVHPFERLRVADCGDVDVVPISIERTLAAIEARVGEVMADGAMPLRSE